MKIACQSCQAKYTIADEKVLGRVVKIRCKKCGATIVINGNEAAADGGPHAGMDEPTQAAPVSRAFDYSAQQGEEPWTVNVADGDQRTMTTADVAAQYRAGVLNDETYCWKDGMGDWLPLREIDVLASACGPAQAEPAYVAPVAKQPALAPLATQPAYSPQAAAQPTRGVPAAPPSSGPGLGALFGGLEQPIAAAPPDSNGYGALRGGAAPAAARRAGGRAGAADLFGGAAEAGGENDVMTSAPQGTPAMHADDGKLTGQRNENSVLFSLNALTQSAPKESTPGPIGDGSGLIDIRALSANMAPKEKKSNHVDDIMNLGGGGAFTAALAAPVLAPPMASDVYGSSAAPGEKNRKLMLVIIAMGVIVAGLLVAVVLSLRKPETPEAGTTPAGSVAAPPGESAAATASAAPVASAAPAASDTSTAVAPGAAAPPGAESTKPTSHHASGGGGGGGGAAAVATPPPAAVPPSSGGGGFEEEMRKAAGGGAALAPAPAPATTAAFDRGAAAAALGAVSVGSCKKGDGPTGGGHVSVTFAPNGSVTTAVVDQPPFAGSAVGGCIAGKFRSARVPPFAGAPIKVGKSFVVN